MMNRVSEPNIFEAIPPNVLGLRKCGLHRIKAHGWYIVSTHRVSVPWLVKILMYM